jgi:N-acetyl-beta-hexosaminidase
MAMVKMNSLHWHLTDDQSFPWQSEELPKLSARGAYAPAAVYTPDDVRQVVEYARFRGIRVIPELDTPGGGARRGTERGAFVVLHVYHIMDAVDWVESLQTFSCPAEAAILCRWPWALLPAPMACHLPHCSGHTQSWGKGHPELLTECHDGDGQPTGELGPLNPARNETYGAVWRLLRELARVFTDPYVHLGSDETNHTCWKVRSTMAA